MKNHKLKLLFFIAVPLLVGGLSALVTRGEMEKYSSLNQPPMSPPSSLFPIVWTILFILMGIASYLVWKTEPDSPRVGAALRIYAIQLVFNFVWSILFFNFGLFYLAFAWLLVLWVLILSTTAQFCRINKTAGWLMVPYLLWVTYAAYLNFAVAILN